MNITRLNFKQSLPLLLQAIGQSHFVALDFQMTGIMSSFYLDASLTDTIQARYDKIKFKAQRFIPIQLGLCPLRIESDRVVYSPFNIYIYPLNLSQRDNTQFSFNSQTMNFLASNKFDFNKLFYEGVPYISEGKIKKFEMNRQKLIERQQITKLHLMNSPDIFSFLNLKLSEVVEWISQLGSNDSVSNQLLIDIQFVRVLAYENLISQIKKKFPSMALSFDYLDFEKNIAEEKNFLIRKYLRIRKLKPEQIKPVADKSNQLSSDKSRFVESLQLNKVWSLIKETSKPLIVHNGFLDLMHLYERFVDDLPASEQDYRQNVNKIYPIIYDTKYICNNVPVLFNKLNKDTSLGNCYKNLRQQEVNQIQISNDSILIKSQISEYCNFYNFEQENCHQAGFDALMTAYTFVNSMRALRYKVGSLPTAQFHKNAQYFLNKVPLGNIRVGYNFRSKLEEYEQDGNSQFKFSCLKRRQTSDQIETAETYLSKQAQILKHFSSKFGAVKIVWQNRFKLDFTLSFLNKLQQEKFIKYLDQHGFGLYSITPQDRFLVSAQLEKQKQPNLKIGSLLSI